MGLFKKSTDFLNNPIDLSAFNPNTRRGDSRVKSNQLALFDTILFSYQSGYFSFASSIDKRLFIIILLTCYRSPFESGIKVKSSSNETLSPTE